MSNWLLDAYETKMDNTKQNTHIYQNIICIFFLHVNSVFRSYLKAVIYKLRVGKWFKLE